MATTPAARAFAERALAELLLQMHGSTASLARARSALAESAADGRAATAMHGCAADIERQGWLFGWLSGELGHDVLFERRERRGLAFALELAGSLLARASGGAAPATIADVPDVAPTFTDAGALCAAVAGCAHAAGAAGLRWGLDRDGNGGRWWVEGELPRALEALLVEGAARIPGSRALRRARGAELWLPRGALAWP